MIKITIPDNNTSERKYIIDIIFNHFLGLEYQLEINTSPSVFGRWEIELKNQKKLIFEDHFFNNFPGNLEYLKFENIPSAIAFQSKSTNEFIAGSDIPIIYGTCKLAIKQNKITCGIDVFASSFFMLTRWEEFVNDSRDAHGRFLAASSIAYKNSFLERPLVNEYIELLWNFLFYLDSSICRKKIKFRNFITCDVDWPFDPTIYSAKLAIKSSVGDLLKGRGLKEVKYKLVNYFKQKVGIPHSDKYRDTLTWMMDVNEKNGNQVAFYFIPINTSANDSNFPLKSKKMLELLQTINSRGHEIGIHPGYECFDNPELFKASCNELQNALDAIGIDNRNIGGRMHYLRWSAAKTPLLWNAGGYKYDSTLSYADMSGFRCGTCHPFPMYDFHGRAELSILQRPLINMEATVLSPTYEDTPYVNDKALKRFLRFKNIVKRFNGEYVLLWHNSYLIDERDRRIYQEIIKK